MNRVSANRGDPIEAMVAGQVACLAGSNLAEIYDPLYADRFGLDTWAISMAARGVGPPRRGKTPRSISSAIRWLVPPVARPRWVSSGWSTGQVCRGKDPRDTSSCENGALPVSIGRLASARAQLPQNAHPAARICHPRYAVPGVATPASTQAPSGLVRRT